MRTRAGKGYRIVYVGHEGHEEAIGTMAAWAEWQLALGADQGVVPAKVDDQGPDRRHQARQEEGGRSGE